jgi:hypothetical protein
MSKKRHRHFMAVSMGMRRLTLLVRNQGLTLMYLETSYIVHFLFLCVATIKKMSIQNEIYDGYEVWLQVNIVSSISSRLK